MKSFGEQFLHKKDSKLHTSKPVELEMERKGVRSEEVSQKPSFLEPYQTHVKPEAIAAAEKKERLTGQTGITQNRSERIRAYLERLEKVFLNEDLRVRERNIELLRPLIHKNALIKKEVFPASYFEFQRAQAKERGLGNVSLDEEEKKKEIEKVIESQKLSLDAWIDYLTGDDAKYPTDIKYFVMQGILKLGNFDTERYSFTQREKTTTAPFPEIDREALSAVMGVLEAKHHNKPTENYSKELLDLIDRNKNFGDMYALVMRQLDERADKSEMLPITDGEWKVFEKGSNPQKIVDALAGKRSNICIADIGSATRYLSAGSVEIYFSYNRAKQPTVPRIAIAINEEMGVYEVRGTYNKSEDIDPYIEETNILNDKMKGLKNGEAFAYKDKCMKEMTEVYKKCFKVDKKTNEKTYLNPTLTKDELIFLYEINSKIEGFGYQRDPRIKEIIDQRNSKEDAPIVFDCQPEQIAYNPKEIDENIKAYIGEWNPKVLKSLSSKIEHVYTKFPDQKVFLKEIIPDKEIRSAETAIKKLESQGHQVGDYAKDMLTKVNWKEKLKNSYEIVSFSVGELFGDTKTHTYAEIKAKALKEGLDLVLANLAPDIRLNYEKNGEWTRLAMNAISGRDGDPGLFSCRKDASDSWLGCSLGRDDDEWDDDGRFFFARK